MTLRRKTFFVVTTILILLLIFLFFLSRLILLNSFLQLEEETAQTNTERVLNTLTNELDQLSGTTADWSYWNDTYEFVQNKNQAYIEDNLQVETIVEIDLNFMIVVDNDGAVVLSKFVDLEEEDAIEAPFRPEAIVSALLPDTADLEAAVQSMMRVEGTAVMVASRHILTSINEGPIQGTLIFGRFLNEAKIERLSQTLNAPIVLHAIDGAEQSANLQPILETVQTHQGIVVQPINDEITAGYTLIQDVQSQPIYLLEVRTPREIYRQGTAAFNYYIVSLAAVGLVFIIAVLLLLDRSVLSRLNQLSHSVEAIRQSGDLSIPIQISGHDELSELALATEEMIAEIAESKRRLEAVNLELEERVRQRTAALSAANEALLGEVAERRQAQEKLAEARDQALEALRLKTQILANVSHDARTPLNVISLRAEMLLWGGFGQANEKQKNALETILVSTRELLRFINNLLEESQANAHRIKIENQTFAPHDLLTEVESLMRPLAEQKDLALIAEVADDLPPFLSGDPGRLKQILNNLVDNAIKFTDDGRVTIRIYRQDAQHWAFSVSDTGAGIAKEAMPYIFDAFWQADGSVTRKANRGVGLGLSIVKQLSMLMKGEISVDSNLTGTTFIVSFPLPQSEHSASVAQT